MVVGVETDRGLWVGALVGAGYQVYAINPMAVSRYRDRHGVGELNPTGGMQRCWPTWYAPTATPIVRSPVTAPIRKNHSSSSRLIPHGAASIQNPRTHLRNHLHQGIRVPSRGLASASGESIDTRNTAPTGTITTPLITGTGLVEVTGHCLYHSGANVDADVRPEARDFEVRQRTIPPLRGVGFDNFVGPGVWAPRRLDGSAL